MGQLLFLDNLSERTTEAQIRDLLVGCGEVKSVQLESSVGGQQMGFVELEGLEGIQSARDLDAALTVHPWRWLGEVKTTCLDDLDRDLLDHWSTRFPKPPQLDFCAYDVSEHEVRCLCSFPRTFDVPGLIPFFVSHNRYGMMGDWRDFPAFAGDAAVYFRRHPFPLEFDLSFFLLHAKSSEGAFSEEDHTMLRRWVVDILEPWSQPMKRIMTHEEHQLDLLVLLDVLGGSVLEVVDHNLSRVSEDRSITPLVAALAGLLDPDGQVDAERICQHFAQMGDAASNQELPTKELVPTASVDALLETMRRFAPRLAGVPDAKEAWLLSYL
jgi:hypothetical protein